MSGSVSQVDWNNAPEDAQFYSCGSFRKYEQDEEFHWVDECTTWYGTGYETLAEHKGYLDFQMRPAITPERMNEILSEAMDKANSIEVAGLKDLIKNSPEQAWCGVMYKDGVPVDITYEQQSGAIKSDGGSSSYYDIQLPDWLIDLIIERRHIKTEELIEVFGSDFDEGNILKCLVRINSLKKGKGKVGNDVTYDANKIIYSAGRLKERDKR